MTRDSKNMPAYFSALKTMNVTGSMVYRQGDPAPNNAAKMPFYCTNLCNQLYLRNKSGKEIRESFNQKRTHENCVRKPSLEDPKTDADERQEAARAAKRLHANKPLGYDLRDEGTYVISSACPFDFDFSEASLACFRQWLKKNTAPWTRSTTNGRPPSRTGTTHSP